MSKNKNHNYLRRHRKKLGLSQEDLAFLLGCKSGRKVSRYENLERQPGLESALICAAVFDVPTNELFWSLFVKIEETAVRRVQLLVEKLSVEGRHRDAATLRKLTSLGSILRNKHEVLQRSYEE